MKNSFCAKSSNVDKNLQVFSHSVTMEYYSFVYLCIILIFIEEINVTSHIATIISLFMVEWDKGEVAISLLQQKQSDQHISK